MSESVSKTRKKLDHHAYIVGWICPLEVEQIAAWAMLDEEHETLPQSRNDHNIYKLGSINGHNVVIAGLHQPGNCPATAVVTQMRITFPNLESGLLVGIGGGVPVETDEGMIRLGHVVVGKPTRDNSGTVQYDHGKALNGRFERTGALALPPIVLLNAAQAVAVHRAGLDSDPIWTDTKRIQTSRRWAKRFGFPGVENDHLYPSDYAHTQPGVSCNDSACDPERRITRSTDDGDSYVAVHRGTIASGELVVKNAALRDQLAQQYGLLSFEMEAAGALSDFQCLVIRGISDYCDSHKNDQWHGFAAAAAAAYARRLFFHLPVREMQNDFLHRDLSASTTYQLSDYLPDVPETTHFVAREDELQKMQDTLAGTNRRRCVVLQGLGGMGKTQLTLAYIRRHRVDHTAVIWFNAKDETTINQSVSLAAERILRQHTTLPYLSEALQSRNSDQVLQAVKRWLDEPGNKLWLLVYDNYDNPRLDRRGPVVDSMGFDIRKYLPETNSGAVIITTRSSVVKLGPMIHLGKLGEIDDCLRILEMSSCRTDLRQDTSATELAEMLDGLPLALASAGSYLEQVSTTCAEYIQLYNQSWLSLHEETPDLLSYHETLYSTWNISYEHIKRQSSIAAKLLQLWSYFDNNDLWYELLQGGNLVKAPWHNDLTMSKLAFDKIMRVLCCHGLVDANTNKSVSVPQGYSVHACVHEWMTNVLNRDRDEIMACAAMDCIASQVPSESTPEYWLLQRRLLAHADRSFAMRGNAIPQNEDLHDFGDLYRGRGNLEDAEVMYRQALEGKERAIGPDHILTLHTVNNLGFLYAEQGKLEDAEAMYQRALKGYKKSLGPDHISTMQPINNLGLLYAEQGKLEDAEAMYQRALKGKEKALGPDHTSTLTTVNNLGGLYADQGKLEDAETMYQRALKGYEKAIGPDHTLTLRTVNNLGRLYAGQGKLEDAEAMYQRALKGKEKALGPDHTSTLTTVNNLGGLLADQGKLEDAEAMYQRALKGYEKSLGTTTANYVSYLQTLENYGDFCTETRRVQDAVSVYKRALNGVEVVFGRDSDRYAHISNKLP